MQEEVENKTVALAINVTKLTARELKTAILKYLESQKIGPEVVTVLKFPMANRASNLCPNKIKA